MAKFWAPIRNIIQKIPIPGVGISIEQAKELGGAIKQEPGGTVIYTPPAQPGGDAAITVKVQRYNPWFILAIIAGIFFFMKK